MAIRTWRRAITHAHRIWKADWTRTDRGRLSAGEHLACMRRIWKREQRSALELVRNCRGGTLFGKNVHNFPRGNP
jgi:hypothetical protein